MKLTNQQRTELEQLGAHGKPQYVRRKAVVLLNYADGRPIVELAQVFRVSRQAIYGWIERYQAEGVGGWRVKPGRGRKTHADGEEVMRYLRQSPRQFGLMRTRWTLQTLAQCVPSLQGYTPPGVRVILLRLGIHYKRGQPAVYSPDPEYASKKKPLTRRCSRHTWTPGGMWCCIKTRQVSTASRPKPGSGARWDAASPRCTTPAQRTP